MNDNTRLESFLTASPFEAQDARLITAIARAGSGVASVLRGSVTASSALDYVGCTGTRARNIHGELVHELDVFANDRFVSELAKEPCCGGVLSEETRDSLDFRSHQPERFVFFDPLDGTSNLEAQGPTGSIFGIVPWAGDRRSSSLLPGDELCAAGYLFYSSSTILVLASRDRVDSFVWQPEAESFVLCSAEISCPRSGSIYSLNEARVAHWQPQAQSWLSGLKAGKLFEGRPYTQLYTGGFVADAHRTLLQGGVFGYPADRSAEQGKLHLQYEVNPMAFIFRAASGAATTGTCNPLELLPENCHERCPVVLGSREEVQSYERALARPSLSRRSA